MPKLIQTLQLTFKVLFLAGFVFTISYLHSLTVNPYNNYKLAVYAKAPLLLVRVVWTLFVSSSPCSSPTFDRAVTPAGPFRTNKIVSCSRIC